MQNSIGKAVKATIIDVIVALLFAFIIVLGIKLLAGSQIDTVTSLLNLISVKVDAKADNKIEVEVLDGKSQFKTYPTIGQKYADLTIESAGISLPVYFGDTLPILKNGVGHSSGSYFPGEGGSIVYCAHNSKDKFRNFSKIQKGDKVVVKTEYGTFTYQVYDMKVIQETDFASLPIQKDKEILMMYTCYPFNALGYTTQRYVVYTELVNWQAV